MIEKIHSHTKTTLASTMDTGEPMCDNVIPMEGSLVLG